MNGGVKQQRIFGDRGRSGRSTAELALAPDDAVPVTSVERPALKALARDTSEALTLLDVDRLEQLIGICEGLRQTAVSAGEAVDASADMAVLTRVLDAARVNAEVMQKLRAIRIGSLEYTERQVFDRSAEGTCGHD